MAAVLVVAPLLVHLPELAGWISCDPLPIVSGLEAVPNTQLLHGRCFIDANVGATTQSLGRLSAESWLSGRVPWWNPFSGVGLPLAAEMQPAAFFLPFILLLHFSAGVLFLKITMQILAGICMAACLRAMRASFAAALIGGLLFQFNGTFAWGGDAPTLPVAFLPLLIAGIAISRTRALQSRAGGTALVAAGLAFSLLAGFPETALINGILAAAWTSIAFFTLPKDARRRFVLKIGGGGVTGVCLAAPALIPFIDYVSQSSLAARDVISVSLLPVSQLAVLLLPTLFGPPFHDAATAKFATSFVAWNMCGGYVCAGTLLAGLAALVALRSYRGLRWLVVVWSLFWLGVFIGEPVSHAVWHFTPVVNQVFASRYAMPSIEFLWAILAALAFDQWRSAPMRSLLPTGIVLGVAGLVIALALAGGRIGLGTGPVPPEQLGIVGGGGNHYPTPSWAGVWLAIGTIAWTACLAAGLTLLFRRVANRRRMILAAGLLAADAIAAFVMPIGAGLTHTTLDLAPVQFLAKAPGLNRSYALGYRLAPNYGSYFGIATLQSLSLPMPRLWADYAPQLTPRVLGFSWHLSLAEEAANLAASRSAFEAAGVNYVLVDRAADPIRGLNDAQFVPVFESQAMRIYELPGAAPYFQIVSGGPCELTVAARTDVVADCQAPATLVRRELFYPGWRATTNGAKVAIRQADQAFQQISLPEGRGRITFRYVPPHANLILILCLSGVGGICVMLYRARRLGDD